MKAIAAMSRNRVIGQDGKTPWHLPAELAWFKRTTLGQVVLMGRKTFASLGGKPLPGRLNLVATRTPMMPLPDVEFVYDLAEFQPENYEAETREVWVIGGGEIFARMLPRCTELYLTVVDREVAGDSVFPPFEDVFVFKEIVLNEAGI